MSLVACNLRYKRWCFSGQVADGSSRSKSDASPHGSDLIFIGTGTSEGIPRVSCLTHPKRRCKVS